MIQIDTAIQLSVFAISFLYAIYSYDGSFTSFAGRFFGAFIGIYILFAFGTAVVVGILLVLAVLFVAWVAS